MGRKYLLVVAVFLSSVIAIMFLPNFSVKELIIKGNEFVSNDEIVGVSGFEKGQNIFLFNCFGAKRRLLSLPFVRSVGIRYLLPDKISINISERRPSCYIKYLNDIYVLIDDEGIVLEISKSRDKNFPMVTGINFSSFSLGKSLKTDDESVLKSAFRLSALVVKNDIEKMNLTMDFSSLDDVHLYVRSVDVLFGDMQDAEYKMALLKSILDSDSEYLDKPSTLYIKDKEQPPILKFIL